MIEMKMGYNDDVDTEGVGNVRLEKYFDQSHMKIFNHCSGMTRGVWWVSLSPPTHGFQHYRSKLNSPIQSSGRKK